MTDLERWAIFLRYAESPDYREVVNRIIESKEALSVAGEVLMSISKDEKERAIFRSRRMFQTDQESNMITSLYNAERKAKIEIARNLLNAGDSIDKIIKVTDLTRDEVEGLRN